MSVAAYQFQIDDNSPTSHLSGAEDFIIFDLDQNIRQQGKYLQGQTHRRWIIHRDPDIHPGTILTIPLQRPPGTAMEGFSVVCRQITLNHDTVASLQAYTWNNPPELGETVLGVRRFNRAQQVIDGLPNPNPFDFIVTVPATAQDFMLLIEAMSPPNQNFTLVTGIAQVYGFGASPSFEGLITFTA